MANHIIVGAGLGGLYEAIRLINKGVKPKNIVIIERRPENHYTRPGHLNHETFDLVTRHTGIPTPHSAAHHIKDLERAMYAHLKGLNVQFIDEEFIGLQAQTPTQPKAVITRTSDSSQVVYPADYVFDCTGKRASVVHAVNSYQQSANLAPAFETSSLTDVNPIQDHLVAHVVIPGYSSLNQFMSNGIAVPPHVERSSLPRQIELREKLRALGWLYEAFPTFYTYPQYSKNKLCLYMETPPNLAKSQQRAWMQLILDIYSNGVISDYTELKLSRKYGEKPRILGFKSVPDVLNKIVHQSGDLPTVIVGFDAVKGFDYRLAHGVTSGIDCCELMLKHLTITNGSIQSIDSAAIENETFAYINDLFKTRITTVLGNRQRAIENAFDYFSGIYERAATTMSSLDLATKKDYQSLAGQLAYQAVNAQFPKLETRARTAFESLAALNKCLSVLLRARTMLPVSETTALHDINNKLLSVTSSIRVEVTAFDIEPFLRNPGTSNTQLRDLFESILKNSQHLEGNFSSASMQNSARTILGRIPQASPQPLSMMSMLSSIVDEINSNPFLLLQLLAASSEGRSIQISGPGGLGFFGSLSISGTSIFPRSYQPPRP